MIIDPSGRGPTMRQLYLAGIIAFVIIAVLLALLLLRYTGAFAKTTDVDAIMTTTGDGLDPNADVRYRGVLVGAVGDVEITAEGEKQRVQLKLKPDFAGDIPANVTARVVPSNVFAVTSIELVTPEQASGDGLSAGDEVQEDTSQGTIALQDTLTTLKTIINKIDPARLGTILTTIREGLDSKHRVAGSTVDRLDRLLTAIDTGTPTGADLLSNMSAGIGAINESAPELLNVLTEAVTTAQTITSKQSQFEAVLFGGGLTVDATNALFAANPDVGKVLAINGANVFGALASDEGAIAGSIPSLNDAVRAINSITYGQGKPGHPRDYLTLNVEASLTPFRPYTAADCPSYGDMVGPCGGAPVVADPGYLPPEMFPRALDSAAQLPPGLPLPAGIQLPDGVQLPATAQIPGLEAAPDDVQQIPGLPHIPGLPEIPGVTQPAATDSGSVPGVTPARYVGPAAVTAVVGEKPDFMQMLLLGSALRGTTVSYGAAAEGGDR